MRATVNPGARMPFTLHATACALLVLLAATGAARADGYCARFAMSELLRDERAQGDRARHSEALIRALPVREHGRLCDAEIERCLLDAHAARSPSADLALPLRQPRAARAEPLLQLGDRQRLSGSVPAAIQRKHRQHEARKPNERIELVVGCSVRGPL